MSKSNLEERAAIHDLLTRYCCALDNGEIEAVVDCFTGRRDPQEPGYRHPWPRRNPRLRRPLRGATRPGTQFRHMISNIAVTITGNRAAASAYLLVIISKDGNHRSLPPGRWPLRVRADQRGQRPMALLT